MTILDSWKSIRFGKGKPKDNHLGQEMRSGELKDGLKFSTSEEGKSNFPLELARLLKRVSCEMRKMFLPYMWSRRLLKMQPRGIIAKDPLSTAGIFKQGAITCNLRNVDDLVGGAELSATAWPFRVPQVKCSCTVVYVQSMQNAIHNIMVHFVGSGSCWCGEGAVPGFGVAGCVGRMGFHEWQQFSDNGKLNRKKRAHRGLRCHPCAPIALLSMISCTQWGCHTYQVECNNRNVGFNRCIW